MEALYSKLYDKYNKLKTKKDSAMAKLNQDQEMKFMTYMSAADDLIEHLRSQNDRLGAEVSDLRSEVASLRSSKDEQHIMYEKLLMDEHEKYKKLSEEIERIHRKEVHSSTGDDKFENGLLTMSGGSPAAADGTSNLKTRKRGRDFWNETEVSVSISDDYELDHAHVGESGNGLSKETRSNGITSSIDQPKCCRRRIQSSVHVTDPISCMFHELVECLVDLKFSIFTQTDKIIISAVHETSGYSFSLRWMNKSVGEEELLYSVLSLGTFERVAPEWMREMMLFSKNMCPVFFNRVSSIIKAL